MSITGVHEALLGDHQTASGVSMPKQFINTIIFPLKRVTWFSEVGLDLCCD